MHSLFPCLERNEWLRAGPQMGRWRGRWSLRHCGDGSFAISIRQVKSVMAGLSAQPNLTSGFSPGLVRWRDERRQ